MLSEIKDDYYINVVSERCVGFHQLSQGVASVIDPGKVRFIRVTQRAQVQRKHADNMADQ